MNPIHIKTDENTINEMQNINTKKIVHESNEFRLLNFDPLYVCDDDIVNGLYNSVLVNSNNRIISIGQPKTVQFDTFKKLVKDKNDSCTLEPLLEGISIQLFYDNSRNKWDFCTKNSIGANYSYYKTKSDNHFTFKEMFLDAIQLSKNTDINDAEFIQAIPKNYCLQFILMHPQHHNVFKIKHPKVYFIGGVILDYEHTINDVYFMNKHENEIFFNEYLFNCGKFFMTEHSTISKNFDEKSLLDLLRNNTELNENYIGYIITHNDTNLKYTLIDPKYKELQEIRGTHPNMVFHYICLRKANKVTEFLKYFPTYKNDFWKFKNMYDNLIKTIHSYYVQHYINKNKELIDKSIFYHVQQIHTTIFLNSLNNGEKKIIKKDVVASYILQLEPACVFHLINRYDM
jgi:hypothetical protein